MVGPLKTHGGKAYLAGRLVDMMPRHTHYVEPYAGGLSVLLSKDPNGVSEVVNDLNGEVTNFWRVLQSPYQFYKFRRLAEACPFSESEWNYQLDNIGTLTDPVLRAWRFFVLCRQSLAGRRDSFAPLSRNRTRRGMNEQASAWIGAVDGLAEVHTRLRRVVVLNRPAVEVIRSQDGPATLFYLDPPYLPETRAGVGEYGECEMSEADHVELLTLLTTVRGKFMLSGYRSALYDGTSLLYGWRRVDFNLPNNAAGGREKRRVTESVWCNWEVAA